MGEGARNRNRLVVSCVLLGLMFLSGPAYPQSASGTITGQVSDQSGAVIPKVTVVVTNVRQGVNYQVTTTNDGLYEALFLPPGEYTATVEFPGFKKVVKTGWVLPPRRLRCEVMSPRCSSPSHPKSAK
jgi:hypothetical protein